MAKITYIEHDGTQHVYEGEDGMTVMEIAIKNSVPGLLTLIAAVRLRDLPCLCR